jgi:hypothetical protein
MELRSTTSGNMLDTFGITQAFAIQDNANVNNVIGTIGFYRAGADNSGTYSVQTYKTGTPTTRLEIDPDGIFSDGSGGTMNFRATILYNTGTGVKIFRAQSTDNATNSVASNSSYVNNAGLSMLAHASARTLTRFGLTLGGYAELLATTGDSGNPNGMIIGSDLNIPIIFGTNNLERGRVSGSGELSWGGDIQTTSTCAFYFGGKTTDGSWRMIRSGDDLNFERRESGSWVSKGSFAA